VAEHDRGSHGCRGVTAAVGGRNAPAPEVPDAVVVVVGEGAVVVETVPLTAVVGLPVAGAAGGGLTLNCVPVTTVTSAPSLVGPRAVMTEPERELATAWAAAWSAGDLVAK